MLDLNISKVINATAAPLKFFDGPLCSFCSRCYKNGE